MINKDKICKRQLVAFYVNYFKLFFINTNGIHYNGP